MTRACSPSPPLRRSASGSAVPARGHGSARWLAGGVGGWLALEVLLAALPLRAGDILFSEIMYHAASGDVREEYLELHNRGVRAYNLAGWRLDRGVDFTLPPVVLPAGGYLIVAADPVAFTHRYGARTNLVGGWTGRLGDRGEELRLINALGETEDSVRYATEGDWAERARGPLLNGHRGWVWQAAHDGGGASLELIQPRLPNVYGQNWAASTVLGGTPGQPNSVARTNLPPLILEVAHAPIVPRSTDSVTVTARVLDESVVGLTVTLCFRREDAPAFAEVPMIDDGRHGDGAPGDQVYGGVLPPQPLDTIVEFYLRARDGEGLGRTWPAPVQPEGEPLANLLYQVDDRRWNLADPLYRVVLTSAERRELEVIDGLIWYQSSDAQMNGTFVSHEAGETEVRYGVGVRLRGTSTRSLTPDNRRVNFANDRRWRGREALTLNVNFPFVQMLGSILFRRAGVPASPTRLVRVLQNNRDLATPDFPMFGTYAHLDVLDSDWAADLFPRDANGNLYRADGYGDLKYLGDDPAPYGAAGFYTKASNRAENDWTDLIALTRTLERPPDAAYTEAVRRAVHVEEWARYFAVNVLIGNEETALGTGSNGDYGLYRGVHDPRFQLVAYDLDTVLGVGGGARSPLTRITNNPAIQRFLTHPPFARVFHAELRRLTDELFAPERLAPWLEQFLAPRLPAYHFNYIRDFMAERVTFVRSQIPAGLEVTSTFPSLYAHFRVTHATVTLAGVADPARTSGVRVQGAPAAWDAWSGAWTAAGLALEPGVNRLLVEALDAADRVLESQPFYLWYDTGQAVEAGGALGANTAWTAAAGPYRVTGTLVVPAGVTLGIGAGTTVFFEPGARVVVFGTLRAEGTAEAPIRLAPVPGSNSRWGGLGFSGATNENRLVHVELAYPERPALAFTNSTALLDRVTWPAAVANLIYTEHSSLLVRSCTFPDIYFDEHVQGLGIPDGGHLIFQGNTFGTTIGYADVIDFTGGQRPGPILQVLDNVFRGGGDDALDLDGTDAHIEGNVFAHFHKNNESTSDAGAIATGTYNGHHSELVVVRNVFFDNDYDLILKEGAVLTAAHNTFVAPLKAVLNFAEEARPGEAPAQAAWLAGNVFARVPRVMGNLDPALLTSGTLTVSVTESLGLEAGPWFGAGNRSGDPRFVNATNDFHLRPGSPALRSGPNGLDMGAYVPAGASIAGEPSSPTWRTEARLTVGGPGIVSYRYRLDQGPWSAERPVSAPIELTALGGGVHRVTAVGRNSAGVWQSEAAPTASRPWTVEPAGGAVRLSELLAWNSTALVQDGRSPDFVELVNDGPAPANLAGWSLTDDLALPRRFVFPTNTVLGPGARLVVFADTATNAAGLHLGFGLNERGDAVYLFEAPPHGAVPLDAVVFGPQLRDLSLARDADGPWTLARPTPGLANEPVALGESRRVRLNEWLARSGPLYPDDFIELFNPDTLPVDVGEFHLTDHPLGDPWRHRLPPFSFIAPRGYLVLTADGSPGAGATHLGFRLEGDQGSLGLYDAAGGEIDVVFYGPQRVEVSEGRTPSGGPAIGPLAQPSPGTAEAVARGAVLLNELRAASPNLTNGTASAFADLDWVELHNASDTPADLEGLGLSDRARPPARWTFPAGASLPPRAFLAVLCTDRLPGSATNTGFGLSAQGEWLYLLDRAESGAAVLDSLAFGPQPLTHALGRVPDGSTNWVLTWPTPAQTNRIAPLALPTLLRFNEWMANPAQGDDWFELVNLASRPVALEGLRLTDDPGVPAKHLLAPRSFIGAGPAAFVRLVADGNTAAGPAHVGFKLGAGGETLRLSAPDGADIDTLVFGPQTVDVAQGRWPDGVGPVRAFGSGATPGRSNAPELTCRTFTDPDTHATTLWWTAEVGRVYGVERTSALGAAGWTRLWERAALTEVLTEPLPPGGATAFYRVVRLP